MTNKSGATPRGRSRGHRQANSGQKETKTMWKEPWFSKILLVIIAAAVCTTCAMLRPAPRPSVWKLDYKLLDEHGSTFLFVDGRTVSLSTRPPKILERVPILLSEQPLYGVLELGGSEATPRVFVLDESKGRGLGPPTGVLASRNIGRLRRTQSAVPHQNPIRGRDRSFAYEHSRIL
jgi:hypothetical protein